MPAASARIIPAVHNRIPAAGIRRTGADRFKRCSSYYFEEICTFTGNYKAASNWVMGPVKSHLNELSLSADEFPLSPKNIADMITLIDEGKISFA